MNTSNLLNYLKANDGAGSGIDADLLDGRNSTGFVQYLGNISEEIFTNPDYKTNYEGIIDGISTDDSNLPDMGWYKIKYFQHIHPNGYGTQIAIPYSTHATARGNIYWRNLDYFKEEVSVIKSIQRGVVQPQNSNYAY